MEKKIVAKHNFFLKIPRVQNKASRMAVKKLYTIGVKNMLLKESKLKLRIIQIVENKSVIAGWSFIIGNRDLKKYPESGIEN